jgi:DNA-binding CsgD family transcriptional regulator
VSEPDVAAERLRTEAAYYRRQLDELAGKTLRLESALSRHRHELDQRRHAFALLSELHRSIGVHTDISSTFRITAVATTSTLGMDRTVFLVPAEKPDAYRPAEWAGFPVTDGERLRSVRLAFPAGFAAAGTVVRANRSTAETPLVRELRAAFGAPSFVCVPVSGETSAVGLLFSGRLREDPVLCPPLDENDVHTLQAVASFVSTTVLKRRVADLEEAGRERSEFFANGSHGWTLALLALAKGAAGEALLHLEPATRLGLERGVAEPGLMPWWPDLIEAYARAGRRPEAEGALAELESRAKRPGPSWVSAAAARSRGLLAHDGDFERDFTEAVKGYEAAQLPFERARTELYLGERLRRVGRRSDARPPLRAAFTGFSRFGAGSWAERAARELDATGETVGPRDVSVADRLTAQELQVAQIVAEGATNREVAAALFLSAKTVEFHLRNVYRKLGLRSRSELARLGARESAEGNVFSPSTLQRPTAKN